MKILLIGDIVGKPGREIVTSLVPELRRDLALDYVIANGENAAGGRGLTPATAREIFGAGVDVITSGNHIWHHRDIYPMLDECATLLRPLNYPPGLPGHGYCEHNGVLVVNAIGRTFLGEFDDPFRALDCVLERFSQTPRIVIVDFHAEATSEKQAMGWYLDGRASAVVGTHTHVATADLRVLPGGTAYVTDLGMTGPMDSVIGVDTQAVIERFLTQTPNRFPVASGRARLNSVLVDIDDTTGRARSIERVDREQGPS